MGTLTTNISRQEIACQCGCGFDTIDHGVISIVQETADYFATIRFMEKSVVFITSGARCGAHNAAIGGASASQHVKGRAIDFVIDGVSSEEVADYLERKYPSSYGIGRADNFTHIDTRTGPQARWHY